MGVHVDDVRCLAALDQVLAGASSVIQIELERIRELKQRGVKGPELMCQRIKMSTETAKKVDIESFAAIHAVLLMRLYEVDERLGYRG